MPYGAWSELTPALSPPARKYAGMAYDPLGGNILLFGGLDNVSAYLNDSWTYNSGTNVWTQLSPATNPSARAGHAMCDIATGPAFFGGNDGSLNDELWTYSSVGGDWTQLTNGVPGDAPAAREYAASAKCPTDFYSDFDFFLWGGDPGIGNPIDEDIWVYDYSATQWVKHTPHTKPTPRRFHSMYYDSDRDRIIMFGGLSLATGEPLNDLWESDGQDWFYLTTLEQPTGRKSWQSLAYDPGVQRAVLAPIGRCAKGVVTTYAGYFHRQGDTFTLDDGKNTPATWELVPVKRPSDVIVIGWAPPTGLTFDLTALFANGDDPTGSVDHTDTAVYVRCKLTDEVYATLSYYSGGKNYMDCPSLLGQAAATLSTQPEDYSVAISYNLANIAIEVEKTDTANDMRDKIAAAINWLYASVIAWDIYALADRDGFVDLHNIRADGNGNTASAVNITVPGFEVSNMSGAVAEYYAYNRFGGAWVEHPEATGAPLIEGGCLVYDATAEKLILFGGSIDDVTLDNQYLWTWSSIALSPYYSYPGSLQGRLQPVASEPTDGQWSFILGSDEQNPRAFMLLIGDELKLFKTTPIAGQMLLRWDWRLRTSVKTQEAEVLVDPTTNPMSVDFKTAGLLLPSTLGDSVLGVKTARPVFARKHGGQLCKISGSDNPANDGIFRISIVPSDIGEIRPWGESGSGSLLQAGTVAVIENASMVQSLDNTNVRIEILGVRWVARVYLEESILDVLTQTLVAELTEQEIQADSDGWQRDAFAAHVSKFNFNSEITFSLKLESSDAGADGYPVYTPLAGLYVDDLQFDNDGPSIQLINTAPEDGEEHVRVTSPIKFRIASYAFELDNVSQVWLTIGTGGVRSLVYDEAGAGFAAGYSGSISYSKSPGSSLNDNADIVINSDEDWPSHSLITVEVTTMASSDMLSASYSFTTEYVAAPAIDDILWFSPRQARLRFREPMVQNAQVGGTLYLQTITGGFTYEDGDTIQLSKTPSLDWIGYYLGMTGSVYPQNNGFFKVLDVDTVEKTVQLEVTTRFKLDNGVDQDADGNVIRYRTFRGIVSSYALVANPSAEEEGSITCAYAPLITAVRAPELVEIPLGGELEQYVIVDFHDDISLDRRYSFKLIMAVNEYDAVADGTSLLNFLSPSFNSPTDRIQLWDLFTERDQDDDALATNQLQKMTCVLQDMLNVLWYRCDSLQYLFDPDAALDAWIPYLLYSLGNPFRLPLTLLEQRRLCSVLAAIYQQIGTAKIIEETLAFFLGGTYIVQPFQSSDWWTLGTSQLGVDTVLGPSTKYAKNCYEIISSKTLTAEEERAARHIAESTLDPLYMHLIRIVQPGDESGALNFWVLGYSALEYTTKIGP